MNISRILLLTDFLVLVFFVHVCQADESSVSRTQNQLYVTVGSVADETSFNHLISSASKDNEENFDLPRRSRSLRTSRISGGSYNKNRVSHVWRGPPLPASSSDKSYRFQHRWKQFSFSTRIQEVPEDFPQPGDSVRGIFLADVCVSSKYVPCTFGARYETMHKITWTLNQLAQEGINFWVMGGDNLYDEDGAITERFFARLSPKLLAVPIISVPGNHDFWTRGSPSAISSNQFGYGYAQFYMMDTEAARNENGEREIPFNFSLAEEVDSVPSGDNFFHYSAIGAVGFIAFSGGHSFDANQFSKACRYFVDRDQAGVGSTYVFLISHWSIDNMGCQPDMYTARVFEIMSDPEGVLRKYCYPLAKQKRLYFVDGHFHDNKMLGQFGMRVAGQGMIDTGAFGFPIVEVLKDAGGFHRLLVSYVALAKSWSDPLVNLRFSQFAACARTVGIFGGCLRTLPFVEVWVNTTASNHGVREG